MMNIFVSDKDPIKAAQNLDNSRVVKMILETAQLLSTAIHIQEPGNGLDIYRKTHENHPCSKWIRENPNHFQWLYQHFNGLLQEYTFRYGKIHASQRLAPIFQKYLSVCYSEPAYFANCCKNDRVDFKNHPDTIMAYRLYLQDKWEHDKRDPKWHNRTKPNFNL